MPTKRRGRPPAPGHASKKGRTTTSSELAGAPQAPIADPPLQPKPTDDPLRVPHPFHLESERHGIVLRNFYPAEMSNARARAYNTGQLRRPIDELVSAMSDTTAARMSVKAGRAVVHWFKMDLRTRDNTALALAARKAAEAGVPLIGLFVLSPQDYEAHLTAPVRVDFMLRTLRVLREDLAKVNVPLWIETVEKRRDIPGRVIELLGDWGVKHLYANMEYEVDELRREAKMVRLCAEQGIAVEVVHDTCVVPPGRLKSGSGNQYAVYSPWFRAWVAHVHNNLELLELLPPPGQNPASARVEFVRLFECEIPVAPESKKLSPEELLRFGALWPPGEHEAMKRLELFCEEKVGGYAKNRNIPSTTGTSSLSVHFAAGTLSARTAVRYARDRNMTKKLDGGNEGIQTWISEIAWRDFYKHVLVNWPYVCMNKPFKPEYANIEWSYNRTHFEAWTGGQTGFPLVDAAMRQMQATGWCHNRCRMVVASFLSKDLLIDWRMGERFFMEHLIDGDFASNNGGWGFAASVGVDPQPYFRIFNPLLQSEKFDPDGEYIRKWVPELQGVMGKAVHDPYGRGAGETARRNGYPEPIVEHKGARERALAAYKKGIASGI
ncbi:DNA photolyase, FAD-binding/Cryptochrome [Coniochaeta sp. 2T2.1]|nr:DNA photolyase, FAD-binding/Cryptochrome [Coniochaeta sp. 2T2.1]